MLVVGSATLAILLVCFSMYQSVQMADSAGTEATAPRTPRPRIETKTDSRAGEELPATDIGTGKIGRGEGVSITIHDPEGTEGRFEINVLDWTPIPGADNEFRLVEPVVRMKTSNNHAVRVTASEGTLEARRRGAAGLDPQRGRLSGDVVIEYDRLTIEQREALPPEQRDVIDPSQVVRIETSEIEFDLEYAKLVMPGSLRLKARDAIVEAANLELRFNEAQNRVESLRINGGGRIELLEGIGAAAMRVAGTEQKQQRTVVDWLRETLRTQLAASKVNAVSDRTETDAPAAATESEDEDYRTKGGVPVDADGVPVFRDKQLHEPRKKRELHYFARFDGSIDASQRLAARVVSRLEADSLEILRDYRDAEPQRGEKNAPPGNEEPGPQAARRPDAPVASERIVVTWADRLVVRAIDSDDERLRDSARARVTAAGSPARISHPEGDAVCRRLSYQPDPPELWLYGSEDEPVTVRSRAQGVLYGVIVHTKELGDRLFVDVAGPGKLVAREPVSPPNGETTGPGSESATARTRSNGEVITFGERLEAEGYVRSKTSIDFTGGMSTERHRLLKTARLTGGTSVRQDELWMQADTLDLRFGVQESWSDLKQRIEGFTGTGHVVMTREGDRLACRELDAVMITAPDGRAWPRRAVARGDVDAEQHDRVIKARDELILDFELFQDKSESDPQWRSGVKRLTASGDVAFTDPAEALDVTAEELDCRLDVSRAEAEEVVVEGTDARPATVKLDDVTTTGRRINLSVRDQRAEVPGPGRMSFRSHRDLDGTRLDAPRPIVVEWSTGMRYEGLKNRAVFGGGVHAYSRSTTTFDCDRLEIEFDEAGTTIVSQQDEPELRWWLFPDYTARLSGTAFAGAFFVNELLDAAAEHIPQLGLDESERSPSGRRAFNREPAVIRAHGHARAVSAEIDEQTQEMQSRMMIRGPKLAVYLRSEVSKMLMEGSGSLLLEQFEGSAKSPEAREDSSGELFDAGTGGEPSKTLIEWDDSMVYDFAIDQTRFEGDVSLKHFSGSELRRRFRGVSAESADRASGRAWFLRCQMLTVDFLKRSRRRRDPSRRLGRLSTSSLRQFNANGSVRFNDPGEGLQVFSDELIYERPRKLLAIRGGASRKARIIKRRDGRLPLQLDEERLFYNLETGRLEITNLDVR